MKIYLMLLSIIFFCVSCKQASNENDLIESTTFEDDGSEVPYNGPTVVELANSAIEGYNLALNRNPNDHVAYYGRGCSKMELEDYKGAIADFTKSLSIDGEEDIEFEVLCHRGNSKMLLHEYNGAIADFTKAINIDPNYADPHSGRAQSYLKIGLNEKAYEDWEQLVNMGYEEYNDSIIKYKN